MWHYWQPTFDRQYKKNCLENTYLGHSRFEQLKKIYINLWTADKKVNLGQFPTNWKVFVQLCPIIFEQAMWHQKGQQLLNMFFHLKKEKLAFRRDEDFFISTTTIPQKLYIYSSCINNISRQPKEQ